MLRSIAGKLKITKTQLYGTVELVSARMIRGWMLDGGVANTLTLSLDGHESILTIRRIERQDVAQQFGAAHRLAGFEAKVPRELRALLAGVLAKKLSLLVSSGGKTLAISAGALDARDVVGYIDRVDRFVIEGWAAHEGKRPRSLALECGATQVPLRPAWLPRMDAAEAVDVEEITIGFRAEIPGYFWSDRSGGKDDALEINLVVDNRRVGRAVRITASEARKWTEAICQAEAEDQYSLFCALEHSHYGGWADLLTGPTRKKLKEFAARFGLHAYAPGGREAMASQNEVPWSTGMLWYALRGLNSRLANAGTDEAIWNAFQSGADELPQVVRPSYYDAIVPSLCRYGLYDRLLGSEDLDLERWLDWAEATDPWQLTIALPAWLARRRLDKAAAILWRLAENLKHKAWINTECLHHAAREAIGLFLQGRCDLKAMDKFIYGYLGVLAAFENDWHSRLYDEALMAGAVCLLQGWERYPDYLRHDLRKGLLKHYALLPLFWQRVETHAVHLAEDHEWALARQDAALIFEWLGEAVLDGDPSRILAALRRFDALGNPDARRFAREWLGQRMEEICREPSSWGHGLLDFLLEEPSEGVRYAAFPVSQGAALAERHPACGPRLQDTLRSLTRREKDAAFAAHRAWGRRITEIAARLQEDAKAAQKEAEALLQVVLAASRQGDRLALDLASWLVASSAAPDQPRDWAGTVRDILAALPDAVVHPDAPLLAALARLMPRLPKPAFGAVTDLLAAKFPEGLPKRPRLEDCVLRCVPDTWPGDTLVVIYSCRKYLDSRIEAIRATWAQDLKARGIPYVILVGDGQDTLEGDVLALDVSDRYEDLPQKTLRLIDWVYEHTDFQYLYKIDDDCYLDVARFFENLSYRQHHYYGRVIRRGEGSMDRLWHQSKSQTLLAQKTLDKSPEPSVYADGGGGWALSRWAMRALRDARATEAGQRLVAISFMEDKLVGDLLALEDIAPSDAEYESYQRRRTFGAAVPVGMWENLFFPGVLTPTVMCHLDTDRDQAHVHALRAAQELWPKKVWPTCQPLRIDYARVETEATNQLELLSPVQRLWDVLARPSPHVVAVVRNEMTLLPHFLAHYRTLGVGGFFIADNGSDDGTREYLLEQPDVALFSVDTEYRYSHYGVAWQQALLGNFCRNRWVVLADADEFLIYPGCEERPLSALLQELEAEGADGLRVGMIDMYPFGDLAEADFGRQSPFEAAPWFDQAPLLPWRLGSGYYNNAQSYVSSLRHRIDPQAEPHAFSSIKTALIRYQPWMRLSRGLHDAMGVRLAKRWAWFAHFKYHAGFKAKVEAEVARGQHFDNAKEYRRYQALLAEGKGCFGAQGISRRYRASHDFENLIGSAPHE